MHTQGHASVLDCLHRAVCVHVGSSEEHPKNIGSCNTKQSDRVSCAVFTEALDLVQ